LSTSSGSDRPVLLPGFSLPRIAVERGFWRKDDQTAELRRNYLTDFSPD
jgi:hypothetical protein